MANRKLTDKQREILEHLKECILQKGYPPAVREICEAVHLKSTSSVHAHLESLEEKGYIRKDPTKPRAIEILDDEFNLARREVINVPIVGTVTCGGKSCTADRVGTWGNTSNHRTIRCQLYFRTTDGRRKAADRSCRLYKQSRAGGTCLSGS